MLITHKISESSIFARAALAVLSLEREVGIWTTHDTRVLEKESEDAIRREKLQSRVYDRKRAYADSSPGS
jgi:hypothetical protein